MKWNWLVASTAWAGIVALAWWLADNRIAICGYDEPTCKLRATAARDDIMVWGAGLGLAALLLLFAMRGPQPTSCRPDGARAGQRRPDRAAGFVRALGVRVRAIRHRRWWVVPAAGAMALSAVLGWYFRGEQSDPYAAISRSYDDLIPAQAGGKSADPFDHLIPAPKAPKLAPEPENPYASLIPPDSAPAPARPVEPRPGE